MTKKIVKRTDANNEILYFYTHSDAVDVGGGNATTSLTTALNSKASASDLQALSDDALRKSPQSLSSQEKEQVHNNIGTESFVDDRAVRYDDAQVLGSEEKTQALTNLGLNGVDAEPTKNSQKMVRSGGVAEAIDNVQYARFDGIQETSVTLNTTTTATGNGSVLFYVPNNVFIYKVGNTYYTLWNNINKFTNGFYNDSESTSHALTTKIFINTIDGLPYSFDGTNFTTVAVDEEPTANSNNIVKSRGVDKAIDGVVGTSDNYISGNVNANGSIGSSSVAVVSPYIPINVGDVIEWHAGRKGVSARLALYGEDFNSLSSDAYVIDNQPNPFRIITIGGSGQYKYIRATFALDSIDKAYIKINGEVVYAPKPASEGRIGKLVNTVSLIGNGKNGVTSHLINSIKGGRTYRVHVKNPNIPMSNVSASGYTRLFGRLVDSNSTETYCFIVMYGVNLNDYYDFTVPNDGKEYSLYFGMRANYGEEQILIVEDVTELFNCNIVNFMPDEYNKYLNTGGNIVTLRNTDLNFLGIKKIALRKGQIIKYWIHWSSSLTTACGYYTDSEDNITVVTPLYSTQTFKNNQFIFAAPEDCVFVITFKYDENAHYQIVEKYELENADAEKLLPIKDFTVSTLSISLSFGYNFIPQSESEYISIAIKSPQIYGTSLAYPVPNNSYTPVRLTGLKNKQIIFSTENVSSIYREDSVLGRICLILSDKNNGVCDEFIFVFKKEEGFSSDDYNAFCLINNHSVRAQIDNLSIIPNLTDTAYLPVGSIAYYRGKNAVVITKDKRSGVFPSNGGTKPFIKDYSNLAIEESVAELVAVMNNISVNIGATDSNWKNPYGGKLYSVEQCYNRTTANDMVRLMVAAMKFPTLIEIMGTEYASIHVFGENSRDKTLKNNSWDKLNDAYTFLHGAGSTMPYKILCVKPGATYASNGTDSYAYGLDGISNTGYSMVGMADINGVLVAFDAANISKTGTSSDHYSQGRLARARATIELLDECKYVIEHNRQSSNPDYQFLEMGSAAIVPQIPYTIKQDLDFVVQHNGDSQFQPASTSKMVGAIAILSILSNLEEYHSIWNDTKELINDSGPDESSPETHVAKAGDVESVRTSLYAMMLVSNGANTLSLARMVGEKIIKSKNKFI